MTHSTALLRGPRGPRATLLGWTVLLLGCSSTPTVIPTKNLDRPTDMAFVCLALTTDGTGQTVLSGQTMDACHPRSAVDPAISANGQRTLGTFAFVPNAGRGEVAVADMDRGRLLDLTPQAPGYGMYPVGGDPEAVAASQDGCWLLTANRTSCDMTLVDPSRLLAADFTGNQTTVTPASGAGDTSHRLKVQTGSGIPLQTTVGEVALLPPAQPASLCQTAVVPRAVATFPACDLVALLDLSFGAATATIASAYYVNPSLPGGFQDAGSDPVCPATCGLPGDAGRGTIDGGASDGGGTVDAGTGARTSARVQPLSLVPDGSRVYLGGVFDTAVSSLDIGPAGFANPVRTELAENPGGITRLRLGIDPFATAPLTRPDGSTVMVTGQFLRNRGAFLYAFTTDNSIRVLDLDGPTPVECDVNINVPADASAERKTQACFPVGTPGRRPLARGPGLRIPVFINPDSPPPLPRDIAFADLEPPAGNGNYHALSGQYGFVLTSSGQVYVLNLAPNNENGTTPIAAVATSCGTHLEGVTDLIPAAATNSFRDQRDVGQCSRTPLTVSIAPQRSVVQTDQSFATTASFSASDGPIIKSFAAADGQTTSWFGYPDPDNVVSRQWDVVWEGTLAGTVRASGLVHSAAAPVAGALTDAGANFCASAVRPGDVLMFSGCAQNSECQPDDRFSCQVSVSGARNSCLPIDKTASSALVDHCARFFGSRMRYEVAQASPTGLTLRLKLDEVPKTTLNRCQRDEDCQPDTDHGRGLTPNRDPTVPGKRPFQCLEVLPGDRRCVQTCSSPATAASNSDSDCRAGHLCETVPWVATDAIRAATGLERLCVEAPAIDAGCFPQPMTSYSVRAGQSFLVTGDSLPVPHTGAIAADGTCRYDAPPSPSVVNRIPLSAPRCPDAFLAPAAPGGADLVQNLPAQAGFNPCFFEEGTYRDGESTRVLSTTDAGVTAPPISAFFENPQIRFVLTNLDTYAGDLVAIHFVLQNGFAPQYAVIQSSYEVLLTLGSRIVTGPTKTPESPIRHNGDTAYPYLYVVDQGRTALTPGSRGQVLRINPRSGGNEIVTFDTTYSGSTPFQLQ